MLRRRLRRHPVLHGSISIFYTKGTRLWDLQWKSTCSRSFVLLPALMELRFLTPSGDGRNDADIVDYFIYFTVHGSACTFIIESAYLRDLEWQSTCSQHCVLMSASMVLRIQTPSGDGRNDAGHCCELSIFLCGKFLIPLLRFRCIVGGNACFSSDAKGCWL